ncbi:hypothetical protein E2C01_069818 [Portunus trituberculatus]|uniref:Uncharacterized protein n=1 Tax=Portunus trituberculatus TaxID=210409 RepID=A0A5B7HR27_PORTR|nr:hypothetical protein [Portunus trituberculatus]
MTHILLHNTQSHHNQQHICHITSIAHHTKQSTHHGHKATSCHTLYQTLNNLYHILSLSNTSQPQPHHNTCVTPHTHNTHTHIKLRITHNHATHNK